MAVGTWLALAAAGVQAQTKPTAPTFCERVARELGMKPVTTRDGTAGWQVKTLGGLGPALFGGSSVISIRIAHDDSESAREHRQSCAVVAKGALCDVAGPAELHIAFKDRQWTIPATAGERAEVRVKGVLVRCEDRPSAT